MTILQLQRRIAEVGRIRIGQQVATSNGKSRPAKLTTFRLTSPNRVRVDEAARIYGGTVTEWEAPAGKQWECVTQTDTLPVIVPPSDLAFSQHFELWSGGGCQRRCDGVTESISDAPCVCNPDNRECTIHTRLSVMLRDLPGLGIWRLDTSGWYAAAELQGAVDIMQMAARAGQMLPAQLRLEQRMVKRGGQTRRFAVPVLDVEISPAQLLSGGRNFDPLDAGTVAIEPPHQAIEGGPRGNAAEFNVVAASQGQRAWTQQDLSPLTPVPESVPERPTTSIAEQVAAEKPRRKSTQQPIPKTGIKPRTAKQAAAAADISHDTAVATVHAVMDAPLEPPPDEPEQIPLDEPEPIRPAQLKKLVILLREAGFGDDDRQARLDYCAAAINRDITSSKDLTVAEASKIIDTLETGRD